MKIHIYTFTYNNAALLPFWLRHYEPWVERIVIYDNNSTDETREIAKAHRLVELRTFNCDHHPEPEPLTTMRNSVWKESRGHADWVMLPDSDELIYHSEGVPNFLRRAERHGYTMIRAFGWEMISAKFPTGGNILDTVHSGVHMKDYSKPTIFKPDELLNTGFTVGCLSTYPVGRVKLMRSGTLMLLHCKRLGWDYYIGRTQECRTRRDAQEKPYPFPHFDRKDEVLRAEFDTALKTATRVVF